jgi:hypothetical protein
VGFAVLPKPAALIQLSDDSRLARTLFLLSAQCTGRSMLDRDLAELYGVKAIRLREQVKRNPGRFPENFTFQLTEKEVENMVSQNAIPSKQHLGGYLPYAFTEHGLLMLANVLKSDQAITMSIRIIEIFVKLREVLLAICTRLKKYTNENIYTKYLPIIYQTCYHVLFSTRYTPDPS